MVWVSDERFEIIKNQIECSIAPEICIEIMSANNAKIEMQNKRTLYFNHGIEEFWLCNENGDMQFFDKNNEIPHSKIITQLPKNIDL